MLDETTTLNNGQMSPTNDSSPERLHLFLMTPLWRLYDHLIDYLTTVAAAPFVDLTLYFELALKLNLTTNNSTPLATTLHSLSVLASSVSNQHSK
jgi:hypothetical protein